MLKIVVVHEIEGKELFGFTARVVLIGVHGVLPSADAHSEAFLRRGLAEIGIADKIGDHASVELKRTAAVE